MIRDAGIAGWSDLTAATFAATLPKHVALSPNECAAHVVAWALFGLRFEDVSLAEQHNCRRLANAAISGYHAALRSLAGTTHSSPPAVAS